MSTISKYISLVFGVLLAFFCLPGGIQEPHFLSCAMILSLIVACYISCQFGREGAMPLTLTVVWFHYVFILPRLFELVFFPESASYTAFEPLSADEISRALLYILPCSVLLLAGIQGGDAIFATLQSRFRLLQSRFSDDAKLNIFALVVVFTIAVSAASYNSFFLEVSVFGPPENWGSRFGFVTRLFDTDAILLILLVWMVIRPKLTILELFVATTCILAWVALTILWGSRGGAFRVGTLLLMALFVVAPTKHISLLRFSIAIVLFAAANVLNVYAGQVARYTLVGVDNPAEQIMAELQRGSSSRASAVGAAISFSQRMGLVDYAIVAIARPPNQEVIDTYLRSGHALKNYANALVIGDVWPEADINTSRLFTAAFRGTTIEDVRTRFLSEPWTIWGYTFLVFGITFGLFITAIIGITLQLMYYFLVSLSGNYAPYVGTSFLFLPVTSGALQLFGLDHALITSTHFAVAVIIALLIARLLTLAHTKKRPAL